MIRVATNAEVMTVIGQHLLGSLGIGHVALWTRDMRL